MINYEFPPIGGGTGVACSQLLAEFAGRPDLQIDLVTSGTCVETETSALADNITVHRLPVRKHDLHYWRARELLTWTTQALRYSDRLSRGRSFALCHCWAGWPSGLIGYHLRRRLPYLVSLRGSDVPGYNQRLRQLDPLLLRPVSRRVWSQATRVVAVSRNLRALALETQRHAVIDVIPNGTDVHRFLPGDPGAGGLLFVGRLIERKGVHLLIEAFGQLAARYPKLTLTIAGDGPERGRLQAMAEATGASVRVRFRGHLDRTALAQAYREAAVLVLPAISDAMPNVVLEAMAAGLAIVTTPTGGSEVLFGNGVLIERPDAAALSKALRTYLDHPELLTAHRAISRRLARGMAWSSVAEIFLSLYREAVTLPERATAIPAREFRLPAAGLERSQLG